MRLPETPLELSADSPIKLSAALLNGAITAGYGAFENQTSNPWVKTATKLITKYAPSLVAKNGITGDELTGFVHACALVRPGKVIAGLEPASVRKKLKDKGFARSVNRDDVYRGAEELGVDLDAHIAFVVAAGLIGSSLIGVFATSGPQVLGLNVVSAFGFFIAGVLWLWLMWGVFRSGRI